MQALQQQRLAARDQRLVLQAWAGVVAKKMDWATAEAETELKLPLKLAWELVGGVRVLVVLDDNDALLNLDFVREVGAVARALLRVSLGILAVPARNVVRQLALVEPFVQTRFESNLPAP